MKVPVNKEALRQWLDERTTRESALLLLAELSLVYIFWNLIFEMPLRHQREALQSRIEDDSKRLETEQTNLSAIERMIASSSFTRNLQRQKQLNAQFHQAGEQLLGLQQTFVPVEALAHVTNDVIAQQAEVVLVSMKTFSGEPWLPPELAKQNLDQMKNIYQHKMELEFRGTYFNTMAFLGHLEKLPWHLYWDHLDYQVLNYPEAKIVARFYVLSNQKD